MINKELLIKRGKLISKARIKMGLTQEELALLLNVSVSTIGMIETGKRGVKNNCIKEWCDTLNIKYSDYISGAESNIVKSEVTEILNPYDILNNTKTIDERFTGEYKTYLLLLEKHFKRNGYKIVLVKEENNNE